MKVIEFGSSRVKVYNDGIITNYFSLNLISFTNSEILHKITDLVNIVGNPDISFFTEWARNNDSIIYELSKLNILGDLRMISQIEEAYYFFKVVKQQYPMDAIICDIGGGSVQICRSESELFSFKIGSIYIEHNVINHGIPYSDNDIKTIRDFIYHEIKKCNHLLPSLNIIVGSTKVASFFKSMFPNHMDKGFITTMELADGINRLKYKEYKDIVSIFPEPKGYMFGTLVLLITIDEISKLMNTNHIYPTDLNWIQYFFDKTK